MVVTYAYRDRVWELFGIGRYDLAEEILRERLAQAPNDAMAHALLAGSLRSGRDKRLEEGLREADEAVRLSPNYYYAHFSRAEVLHDLKRYQDFMSSLLEAIRLDPEYVESHVKLADAHQHLGQWDEAFRTINEALRLDPRHAWGLQFRAWCLARLDRPREAEIACDEALAIHPNDPVTHWRRGWLFLNEGHLDAAIERFKEALRIDPDDPDYRRDLYEAMKRRFFSRWWVPRGSTPEDEDETFRTYLTLSPSGRALLPDPYFVPWKHLTACGVSLVPTLVWSYFHVNPWTWTNTAASVLLIPGLIAMFRSRRSGPRRAMAGLCSMLCVSCLACVIALVSIFGLPDGPSTEKVLPLVGILGYLVGGFAAVPQLFWKGWDRR